jgi:hypothetical protein
MPFAGTVARCNQKKHGSLDLATPSAKIDALEKEKIDAILIRFDGSYLKAAKELGVNRGTLYAVHKGKRKASNTLRHALGLPHRAIMVDPLPCGHAPAGKRCAVCGPQRKRKPDPVIRLKKIRAWLQSPYKDS